MHILVLLGFYHGGFYIACTNGDVDNFVVLLLPTIVTFILHLPESQGHWSEGNFQSLHFYSVLFIFQTSVVPGSKCGGLESGGWWCKSILNKP